MASKLFVSDSQMYPDDVPDEALETETPESDEEAPENPPKCIETNPEIEMSEWDIVFTETELSDESGKNQNSLLNPEITELCKQANRLRKEKHELECNFQISQQNLATSEALVESLQQKLKNPISKDKFLIKLEEKDQEHQKLLKEHSELLQELKKANNKIEHLDHLFQEEQAKSKFFEYEAKHTVTEHKFRATKDDLDKSNTQIKILESEKEILLQEKAKLVEDASKVQKEFARLQLNYREKQKEKQSVVDQQLRATKDDLEKSKNHIKVLESEKEFFLQDKAKFANEAPKLQRDIERLQLYFEESEEEKKALRKKLGVYEKKFDLLKLQQKLGHK